MKTLLLVGALGAAMLVAAEDDPEYWSAQGWWRLYDQAKCDNLRA